MEVKLPPPLNLLPRYLAKRYRVAVQIRIHVVNENNPITVRRHLFHEFP